MQIITYKIAIAEVLGTRAFNNNNKRIFCLDPQATELLKDNEVGNLNNIKIMDAWYKGWDLASLNQKQNTMVIVNEYLNCIRKIDVIRVENKEIRKQTYICKDTKSVCVKYFKSNYYRFEKGFDNLEEALK